MRKGVLHGGIVSPAAGSAEGADAAGLLRAHGLVRVFGGVAAVDGVSFTLRRGEILGLIGPNGAGKSTLFDLLAGNRAPTRGAIALDGRAIQSLPSHRRAALGLGRTFQIPRPFPEMTVVENAMLGRQGQAGERVWPNWLAPGRVAREERDTLDRAMAVLDFLTLGRLAREPARVLSGGQRKLLELGRVLMGEPKLMLLDEPAAGVNPALLETVADRILAINRRGVAMVLIEHNMGLVARLCGRVLAMASGRILCEGTPAEVTGDARVVEAYLGGGG